MYLKQLKISRKGTVIRDIRFHQGINLIVDETGEFDKHKTGNNIGKTTVLKVIDYCLGASPQAIYRDPENTKSDYLLVKNFLEDEEVIAQLVLTDDLMRASSREVSIERNFLPGKQAIRRINGSYIMAKDFENELAKMLIPELEKYDKPSFRQVISHNIRYKEESVTNTLKTLDKYTTGVEYEALYLFLLGCPNNYGEKKQELMEGIKKERAYYDRVRGRKDETELKLTLKIVEDEILNLDRKKGTFNLNPDFEKNLSELNEIKCKINRLSSSLTSVDIRINLIKEAVKALEDDAFLIDINQLRILYDEAVENLGPLHKTFENLVGYHNQMLAEKAKYLSTELPLLESNYQNMKKELDVLLASEKTFSQKLVKGDSFKDLEEVITALNEQYKRKGEIEALLNQLQEAQATLDILGKQADLIDRDLFSQEFRDYLFDQVGKLNAYFSMISSELYGEQYYLAFEKKLDKKTGRSYYAFTSSNMNVSSGKKQGEILCFDLAYTLFADEEQVSCLHFLLNDKKELMHGNQLVKVAEFAEQNTIQLVFSILEDKLPKDMSKENSVVLRLSQEDKFFKIEETKTN